MKGEISRYSHRPEQRYSGLFWQMGRMLTDADEIELREIVAGAVTGLGDDAVGSGAPVEDGVVELNAAGNAVALRPGIVYADGLRGEVQASTGDPLGPLDLYDHQVDFPNAPATADDVVYYVDIWERTVTAVEDQGLLDAGLHGADTSFRTQLMAQIKWCPQADPPFFETAANPQKGNALLTAELRAAVTEPDPCDPCAEVLELDARVGNYLFRLEVHDVTGPADNPDSVVLKWSAENGAEHHPNGQEPADFQTSKHAYEFYSDESEKHAGAHGSTGFTPTRRVLDDDYPASPPDPALWPFVRRWDGFCALERSGADLALSLDGDGNPVGEDEGVPLTTASGLGHVEMSGGVLTLELTSLELTLDTAGKSLLAGDYWLVEVRERAPHDETTDQRVKVVTNAPLGIVHHYTGLISADAAGAILPLSDAERRALSFPPLTDIPASHVSFDNTCPDLYGPAENVQEALAALCDADLGKLLREHNRHLHGWGVVCGLKVVCAGSDTPKVAVTPGFMLDQAGYQITLPQQTVVDTLDLLGGATRSGTFCLSASRQEDGTLQFHLDEEDEKTTASILEGTLLWRIYQNCIEPLRKAWEELGGGNQRDVRWALIDLLWPILRRDQTINDRPYLTPEQHVILQQIYKALQERIASPTDCALATEFPDFPAYPFAAEDAMHGMSFNALKPEVRIQADGKRAYLFGPTDSEIVIVDLEGLKIERTVALKPAGLTVLGVLDVAANADGSLVAAAVRAQELQQKPMSAILRIGPRSVSVWHQTSELSLTEVELPGGPGGPLYVLSPGKGVYRLAVNGTSLQQIREGSYVAHLRVNLAGSQGWAVQAKAGAAAPASYLVESFSLGSRSDTLLTLSLGAFEPADLAVTLAGQHVAVAGLTDGGVELRIYAAQSNWSNPAVFLLGQGTPSLATTRVGDQELFAVSLGQQTSVNSLWWFDPFKESLRQSRFLNLQILPTQIDGGSERLVAINQGSQSLLRVSAATLLQLSSNAAAAAVRTKIEAYRKEVIAAFVTLAQLWLKAVRDCICHQLLPDCPVLGEPPHKVPLASLELVEGVVDKICNLGCRKFVVTFPTLFYWLSIVPLIPWLHALLRRWCCEEEFEFLSRLVPDEAEQPSPGVQPPRGLDLQQATANAALSLPLLATSPQFATSLTTLKDYADRYAGSRIMDITRRVVDAQIRSPDIAAVNVAGKSADLAQQDLAIRGVKVAQVIDLEQSALPRDLDVVDAAFTPLSLTRGDEVVLVTRGGQALFPVVRRQPAAGILLDGRALDLTDVRADLDSLARRKEEIAAMEGIEESLKGLSEDRSAVGAELESLKSEVARLKEEQSSVKAAADAEQARLDQLVAKRAALAKESQLLVKDIEDTDARFQEMTRKTRAERPVETLTADKEISNHLLRLGLDTVATVASIEDPRKLVGGPINLTTARSLIRDAQRRVKG